MTDQSGEVSELDRLEAPFDDGDDTPDAEHANQVADGAPKNYGDAAPDENLEQE